MFGLGRDPDLPQVTLWRDFEEPVQLPTVQPGDLRNCVLHSNRLARETTLDPGELSFVVSHPSPPVPATASEQNEDDNKRSTSGEEHGFEVVHVNGSPESACFKTYLIHRESHRAKWLHVFSFLPGFHPVVKVLLTHGADPNSVVTDWGLTPLHIATTPDTVRLLLDYKADVDVKDRNGWTPLLQATFRGHHSVVEILLAHGANPNIAKLYKTSPLHHAKSAETAELLIQNGAEVNVKDEDHETPLFVATKNDLHSVVEVLLANGADPNIANRYKRSPLHHATSAETAELLIVKGAEENAKDENGKTPLFIATENGRHSVVEVLFANQADPNIANRYQQSPLHRAKSVETAEFLIVKGAEVNVKDRRGKTPLFVATEENLHSVVEVLVAHGAEPNIANEDERSPLHNATSAETAELLIVKGAEVNAKDKDGRTPLFEATEKNRHSVVKILLGHGADPNITPKDGHSPLHAAMNTESFETAKLLIEKGANVDCIGSSGETALHWCCFLGRGDLAKLLLSKGASPDIRDKEGQTAYEIAISRGYVHVASCFHDFFPSVLSSTESRFRQEFEVLSEMGEGGYGKVYKVKKKADGKEYALKSVTISGWSKKIQRSLREVSAMLKLTGPAIVKCYDAWIEEGECNKKVG
ncbi:unnamed protein product [Cyprideis torosa]|uniref:Uncharacterized protein n=1 Tax=Cyprideis torosa TaxID=163714 RepID=A0A7R8ZPV6_9CRUS|nr:unnamed protein product [Cyprideis torosa]CAG0899822.1 unnamed protein product [Cyprideis torosa]